MPSSSSSDWPSQRSALGGLVSTLCGRLECARERVHLGLVEVTDRVERARHVAEERSVAEQQLGLVGGAEHERRSAIEWS